MKYVAGYSEIKAGAYNIPVHTIYEYAEVVKERAAERAANDALTIQLAALQAKLSAVQAGAEGLREAVQRWADYISDKGIEALNLDGLPRWVGAVDEEVQLLDTLAAYQAGTGEADKNV